jgi:hypothetical protein
MLSSAGLNRDPNALMFPQGNMQSSKRHTGDDHPTEAHFPPASPPCSPGSPLTYSPQMPMEPIPKHDEAGSRAATPEFHGLAGWPAQPTNVPVVIVCKFISNRGVSSAALPVDQDIHITRTGFCDRESWWGACGGSGII